MSKNEAYNEDGAAVACLREPFIGKREVARRIGRTVRTVDNWMRRGLLPYYKCNNSVSFRWSEIQVFMRQNFRVCRLGFQGKKCGGKNHECD